MTVVYEAVPMGESQGPPVIIHPRRWWMDLASFAALGLLLLIYACVLAHYFGGPAIVEPDDNGYFAQGTLLAQTGHTWFTPQSDAQFIGMHWLLAPSGKYISRYPPGLPVAVAVLDKLFGWRASTLANAIFALLALVGIFLATRRLLADGPARGIWALAAAALLAANPTFFHQSLNGGSHMGVACLILWGIYLLLAWQDTGWIILAFLAGLVLGCIPAVRYADAIMGLGVIAFLLLQFRDIRRPWVHWIAAAIGAMIPLSLLLIRDQLLFGAFWRTGYSLTNEETGFSWAYFKEHVLDYIWQINSSGLGLLFGLGLAGICGLIFAKTAIQSAKTGGGSGTAGVAKFRWNGAAGIMLGMMTLGMILLYMAYYWAPQNNDQSTMRFMLPTFGLFTLAAVWAGQQAIARAGLSGAIAAAAALLALQLLWGGPEIADIGQRIAYQKAQASAITDGLEKTVRTGDVVVAYGGGGGGILQDLDFVREWKVADATYLTPRRFGGFRGGGGLFGNGDPDAPSPRQAAKQEELAEKYVGTPAEIARKFATDLRDWANPGGGAQPGLGDHKIWIVGTESQIYQFTGEAGGHVTIVDRIKLPTPPEPPADAFQGPGGFGGFGGRGGFGPRGGGRRARGPFGGPGGGGFGTGFQGEPEALIAQWTPR